MTGKRADISFENIYDEYYEKIRHYLSGIAGPGEADDLAQDVFHKVNLHISTFRGDSSLNTWIYRIATNTANDRLRRAASRRESYHRPFPDDDQQLFPGSLQQHIPNSTDKTMVEKEMRQCIREFVGKIPEEYRAVVMLSDFEEFSNQEIADILGLTLANVKIRLHRAKAMLKEVFRSGCEFYYNDNNELACNRIQPDFVAKTSQ